MSDALPLVDAALRGALAATALLIGAAFARIRRHATARVGGAFMAGLVVQCFATLPWVEQGWPLLWQAPLIGLSLGNSVLFWLFARALFNDDLLLGKTAFGAWAAVVLVGAGFCMSFVAFGPTAVPTVVLRSMLRWIPAVCAMLVVVAAVARWRVDLVERRRRLRAIIVVAGSLYALTMTAMRIGSTTGVLSTDAARVDVGLLLCVVFGAALTALRIEGGGLFPDIVAPLPPRRPTDPTTDASLSPTDTASSTRTSPLPPDASPSPPSQLAGAMQPVPFDALDARLADSLDRLMTHDRAYRIDDLTLGLLALKISVPEHRLRRFIHLHLGHRNFNAYVNGLRVAEARTVLADPARRKTSVLEIAMTAGFASIGPFNRAFKAIEGVTPSDFRRHALTDL